MSRRSLRETTEPRGPFSRPLDVHTVPEAGLDLAIEASPEERAAVAAEIGLVALGALSARFHIERRAGGRLAVDGLAEAGITQTCVVSLEPFESIVERELELAFAPQANSVEAPEPRTRSRRREQPGREPEPIRPLVVPGSDDQEDPPDPIVDGRIDLGAVAVEFLTLSLDPYPRKPGVHFTDVVIGEKEEAKPSPFAALQRLKDHS